MAQVVDAQAARRDAERRKRLAKVAPPEYADFASLESNPPPDRVFAVDEMLPMSSLAALFGGGGVGKSLIAQQLATCLANGVQIFGKAVRMGPVLGFLCEDDEDELRRRQRAILAHLGRSANMSSEGLHLAGRAGLDNTLATVEADRRIRVTPFFELIESEIERLSPVLVILDNIAQMYGGAENDRHQVTAFCNLLTGWARKYGCAVLLLGHVAKGQGSEFSGSTAWEAAVRTRLWLERRDDGMLELHRKKANYAAQGSVLLEYRHGAFAEVSDTAGAIDSHAVAQAEADVLNALDVLTQRQVATSQVPSARTYLPRLARDASLLNGTAYPNACRALDVLIDRGSIAVGQALGWRKQDRHPAIGLARKAAS